MDPFKHLDEPIQYLTDPKLVALKNRRREELREEFFRKKLNPHNAAFEVDGTIFDPALQRYISTHAHMTDYYKSTPKTSLLGVGIIFIPIIGLTMFFNKLWKREELQIRTGQIAYKDRKSNKMA